MQIVKPITITTTGELKVTVTPTPAKGYLGDSTAFVVSWTPYSDAYKCTVTIDYGDGTKETKTDYHPVSFAKTYGAVGTKPVSATVKDPVTLATGTGSTSVEVATKLTATFTATPTTGVIPLPVTFTFSMSGGYTPYTWTLDPADGTTPYSKPTSPKTHTYTTVSPPEGFIAKLTVTDALGSTAIASLPIFGVEVPVPPEVWTLVETLGVAAPIVTVLSVIAVSELKKAGILT